jgi:4-hydroxy-3-polyprenylbenzoate decarboxylase
MSYANLSECVDDLERTGRLLRFTRPIDPHLEIAAVLRRLYAAGGPAVLFTNVKGTPFPVVGNLFGTVERARFMLRHGYRAVEKIIKLKADPAAALRCPWELPGLGLALPHLLPQKRSTGPILRHQTRIDQLPRMVSWPDDGGPFVTLPQVYSEDPNHPGWMRSNLGMYRVQLSGNQYRLNDEVGLHYQLHRGLGIHHSAAAQLGRSLPVNVLVGGPPALALSAVMPLPEGLPELSLAGLLAGRRLGLVRAQPGGLPIVAEADFAIVGRVRPGRVLPEGPFGDHLGYYSLIHDFPVLEVDAVYHRPGAIWPCTTVGRPPQEDTVFGELIHALTGPVLPTVLPGVKAVHAVDAAGVHPLLLVQASERYVPYQARSRPQELLTSANAVLGQGQLSLAKYLWICAGEDDPGLDLHNLPAFFSHMLRRVDWSRDLHFQTETTMDTLDYSGTGLHQGSKLVVAAVGPPLRELPTDLPAEPNLPDYFGPVGLCLPGVAAVSAPAYHLDPATGQDAALARALRAVGPECPLRKFPLWVLTDSAVQVSASLNNFIWTTFTRSNPAADLYGLESFTRCKHWGCRGPLVIDARAKPHHALALEEDPIVSRRVEGWAALGQPLAGLF